jgi:hypothetical protein
MRRGNSTQQAKQHDHQPHAGSNDHHRLNRIPHQPDPQGRTEDLLAPTVKRMHDILLSIFFAAIFLCGMGCLLFIELRR